MTRNESRFAVVVTGLALVGLGSLPAVSGFVQRFRKREARQEVLYEDADGKATVESQRAYSAKVPKTVILLSAAAGFTLSIAIALLSTNQKTSSLNDWLSTGAWGALLFQGITIASSRKSVQAFDLGIYSFLSSAVLSAILFVQGADASESLWDHNRTLFVLRAIELALAGTLAIASLSIPRRPDVFIDGEQVDRMFTGSALSRFTYAWPSKILDLAVKKRDLDLTDLNRPDHFCRAADTSADWKRRNYRHNLWLSVILAHKKAFSLQWGLTLCTAFLNFSPQWVILQLLRILENPEVGTSYGFGVWYWVFFLGVAMIAQSWVEAYVFWLSWSDLAIPIRAQLSALIFEKSMRKKDVKGAGKAKEKEKATEPGEPLVAGPTGEGAPSDAPPPEPAAEVEAEDEDDSDELKKGKQNTVNLIGVDAKRVSDFSTYQNMFPGSLFKLIVSLTFLTNLLGWKALLAGFSAMLAIMPVNIHFSKKYAAAQDKLMKVRDEKMGVVTEALQGIRQIKFSALEPEWENKIGSVRDRELGAVWKVFMADTALLACWVTSPILLSAISLAVYAALNGVLTPSVAFVSLGVFRGLEVTLSVIPELTTDLLDAWISIKRMQEYLDSPEVTVVSQDAEEVSFQNASIAWPSDEAIDEEDRFVLRNISVTFPKGELSVISGKTGTGKSLMLSAILGEVDVLEGTLFVPRAPSLADRHDDKANKDNWIIPSAIAYVAQIPWIENATIKENILFGLPFDEERYNKTIEVCALKKDLEMLTDGENTEIGQNGINLSGGQKWRITLARAIYSRAGILVLDDIFSAVDAHVGRHIFDKCLNGVLATGRTRILVTHHVALCEPKTKYLVELGDGGVLEAGSVDKLRAAGALDQIKRHEESPEEIEADESAATAVNSDDSVDGDGEQAEADANALKKVNSKTAARKFVEDEGREKGAVKKQIYYQYLVASGGWSYWTVALMVFVVVQALNIGRSWWLKIWTGDYDEQAAHSLISVSREQDFAYGTGMQQTSLHTMSAPSINSHNSLTYYLSIYVLLAFISSIIGTLKFLYIYIGSIRASRGLFRQLNFTILRAPIRWLDTVPVGRILNRFTSDFNIIDSQMANSISFGVNSFLNLLGVIVAGLFVSPYIVLLAGFLLFICLYYAIRYLEGARPVKRLESTTKSPVFEQFGSALSGVATIRGFDKSEGYIKRMYRKVDEYSMATWHLWLFNRWMGWRMSLVGSFFASFVAILILITPGIDSALAGFALAFALEFSNCVMWTIRLYANVELNMNAAERIVEYASLPTESLEGSSPPAAWPTDGCIEVNDLVVSYAPDLPPVLKGLTFSVNRNERIGVVGRTGAGKSSLTLALFRFLEARSGSIHIDGIDISTIKLHDLRSRLAIIPQDPVLFSGTVRSNLDPFNHQTDAELRESLERVHLISDSASTSGTATPAPEGSTTGAIQNKNTNIFKNLDSQISEGGLNLSQGQRQLLCLARAIVSRPRVMVLDEATSAVDMHTDALIQRSIREEFTDATLLVIAHRLSTIADFDRILVLSDGKVAEFGTPRELWEKDGGSGVFRGMCEESGEKEKLRDIVYGK
ncbi:P-loop containing nucleoside triphosphate hydrolase protein [Sordaria brevicollis]|uniref:P-loop containing nucleoside triphosphate hydrolase protein n=1 Tax=Sordaria brevicollis TaxID=83679 RepID=A0AAE0PDX8_SORBR|nr:P-loop containing nucleoside triphosphate hydrolase protein [Sordaria brevicollis]